MLLPPPAITSKRVNGLLRSELSSSRSSHQDNLLKKMFSEIS